jgi:hypothetical protein
LAFTLRKYSSVKNAEEEAWRKSDMRMSVHRTMTGHTPKTRHKKKVSKKGWEAGAQGVEAPKINVLSADD